MPPPIDAISSPSRSSDPGTRRRLEGVQSARSERAVVMAMPAVEDCGEMVRRLVGDAPAPMLTWAGVVVLASKVYGQMGDWPNESRLSVLAIRKACEDSLRRLQTDHIDLYQMHHIDRSAWWDEIWQAMELLVEQGKVLYVGSSNFAGWHIARANEIAHHRNFLGLASEQSLYNLNARTIEMEVIPAVLAQEGTVYNISDPTLVSVH